MNTALRSIGKYELHRRLASSHMDEMWLARDPHAPNYVLLKVFYTHHQADSDVMRTFVNQAEAGLCCKKYKRNAGNRKSHFPVQLS
jgi:hypothetical protein